MLSTTHLSPHLGTLFRLRFFRGVQSVALRAGRDKMKAVPKYQGVSGLTLCNVLRSILYSYYKCYVDYAIIFRHIIDIRLHLRPAGEWSTSLHERLGQQAGNPWTLDVWCDQLR
jgi:hypothetical protein